MQLHAQYVAGFFDGDGSIAVEKLSGGYTLRVKLFQSDENLIDQFHSAFPFLHKGKQDRGRNRTEYSLRASGHQIIPLLLLLKDNSILKYQQVVEATKFLDLVKGDKTEKEAMYTSLKMMKVSSSIKPYERLTVPYIAGLFEAEGSIGLYTRGLRVKLTQKSDVDILQKIGAMYNNTNAINNYALCFYGSSCKQFLIDMSSFCIYKLPQIKMALDYIDKLVSFDHASAQLKVMKRT